MRKACVFLFLSVLFAISQALRFRFERPVQPAGPGANRIAPDTELLSGTASSDLRDLRFFDRAGKEVPYLLIPPDEREPQWRSGRLLSIAATEKTSGFDVDLGSAFLVDRFRVTGFPAPFLKRLQLEASGDRSHWTLLQPEGTLFDLPDDHLRLLEIPFISGEYRYFRVTWDDRESGVVPMPGVASARLLQRAAAPAPLHASAEFRKLSAGPGRSRFQIRLPGPHLPLAAIELGVQEARLLRTARVTEGRLSGAEVIPNTLGSAQLRRVVRGKAVAADLRIPIRNPEGREIELAIDDESNPPLNLVSVTLEFEPLPWIYFESSGGEQIVARYGDPRLSFPKYDLEAMREDVTKAGPRLRDSQWGQSRDAQPADPVTDSALQPAAGAPLDPKTFRYSRQIPVSPAGLTALLVDAAVLAHSREDLADLRIADSSGHQVPYLLEKMEDVLSLDLSAPVREVEKSPPASIKKNQSRYKLVLPYENLPASKVVLTTSERLFQRTVALQAARPAADARSEPEMETVTDGNWRHADPETPAPPLSLDLRPVNVTTIRIVVDEGDNRPLVLSSTRLELPLYRLRFFYPASEKLTLLYGQRTLEAPRYDLALLAPRLVGVSSRELALDAENVAPTAPDKNATQTRIFWAALVGAVVVLLALLGRLLRPQKPA